jgi:FAD-linked sulfhydryl oxidase
MDKEFLQAVQAHCSDLVQSIKIKFETALARRPILPPQKQLHPQIESTSGFASQEGGTVTKESVGRATWTLLHTIAAHYPETPNWRQRKDAKELMGIISRLYPCGDCAYHFRKILEADPPQVASKREFAQWLCRVHNTVNRSLNKPAFNCNLVDFRWSPLECDESGSCAIQIDKGRNVSSHVRK